MKLADKSMELPAKLLMRSGKRRDSANQEGLQGRCWAAVSRIYKHG